MTKVKYDTLCTESGSYETTLNKMYNNRKPWKPVDIKEILSFMPGTVEEFKVKVGDKVKKGQPLMAFRAMKMSNIILAPIDGKVKALNANVGENLPKNTVMMVLE